MDSDVAKQAISQHAGELRELGVSSLSLFGSTARGEARAESDVDVLIELSPAASVGLFGLARIQQRLEDILGGQKVDLILRQAVPTELEEDILTGAVLCLSASGTSE